MVGSYNEIYDHVITVFTTFFTSSCGRTKPLRNCIKKQVQNVFNIITINEALSKIKEDSAIERKNNIAPLYRAIVN